MKSGKKKYILLTAAFALVSFSACGKKETYDWTKVDDLMVSIGEENNAYYADGTVALRGMKVDIYHEENAESETVVRLQQWPETANGQYYSLTFNKHYYELVEEYVVTVQYTCSFHYEDAVYQLETTSLNVFEGKEENVDNFRYYSFYQVENKKMKDGAFLSCDFTERSVIGAELVGNLVLPASEETYFNELMTFGFERTTAFLLEYGLERFY